MNKERNSQKINKDNNASTNNNTNNSNNDSNSNNRNSNNRNNNNIKEITVFISGIHCACCVANLENVLLKIKRVIESNISIGEDINSNK